MPAKKVAALAAISSLALTSIAAQARDGCWYPNEAKAAQLLHLNTNLMIGALHCRDRQPDTIAMYDGFVDSQIDMLRAHHAILQQRFDREHGSAESGRDAYRQYRVSTANRYAAAPMERNLNECERVMSLADVASGMSRDQLLMLAASFADAPVTGPCRPSRFSYDTGPAAVSAPARSPDAQDPWARLDGPTADLAPAPYPNEAPSAAPAMQPAVVVEEAPTPAPLAETAPTLAAAAPEASASSTPEIASPAPTRSRSSEAALQSAVAALQAATAALSVALSEGQAEQAPEGSIEGN